VKPGVRPGLLPGILAALIAARAATRAELKATASPAQRTVLDSRQKALKLAANALYGFTGAPTVTLPYPTLKCWTAARRLHKLAASALYGFTGAQPCRRAAVRAARLHNAQHSCMPLHTRGSPHVARLSARGGCACLQLRTQAGTGRGRLLAPVRESVCLPLPLQSWCKAVLAWQHVPGAGQYNALTHAACSQPLQAARRHPA